MDDEAKQRLREIRDLTAAANTQQSAFLAESRKLQEEAVGYNRVAAGYNRKAYLLSFVFVIALVVMCVIAAIVALAAEAFLPSKPLLPLD